MRKNTKKRTGRNARKTAKKIYGGDIDAESAGIINTIIFNGLDRMVKTYEDCMKGINEIIKGTILNTLQNPINEFMGEKFNPLVSSIATLIIKNEKNPDFNKVKWDSIDKILKEIAGIREGKIAPDFNKVEWDSIDKILKEIAGIREGKIAPEFLFPINNGKIMRKKDGYMPIYIRIETKINDALANMIVITDLIQALLWVLGK
jgi:hypothetical protein